MTDDIRAERHYMWNTLQSLLDALETKNIRLAYRIIEAEIRRVERDD